MPNTRQGCQEFRQNLSRRHFVKAGAMGVAGLELSDLLRLQAKSDPGGKHKGKSLIILWKRGGPSQHETWDPKPDAPQEYRGAFGATSTKVPGIQICDLLPKCAAMMDKFAIIRSLHHTDAGHSAGDQIMFTGYPPNKNNPGLNVHPSIGSIVAEQQQAQQQFASQMGRYGEAAQHMAGLAGQQQQQGQADIASPAAR